MVIYITTNLINNKKYIGRDLYNNSNYLGSGKILKSAIKKYGKENFKKEILEYCNNEDELNEKEIYWINKLDAINNDNYYNIVDGGRGGYILRNANNKLKKETYNKISDSKINVNLSDEHINKIKNGMSKYENTDKINKYSLLNGEELKKLKVGKYNNFYNKKHKGDLSRFGKHRKNMSPTNALKVLNITLNKKYDSLAKAAEIFDNPNTARRAISDVCKGHRENYNNMKFKFINV